MAFVDRYRAAGLRSNPFTAPEAPDAAPPFVLDRNCGPAPTAGERTLVQVIGDSGFGKSTQLSHWRAAAPGPYHYIPRAPYRERWATPPIEPLAVSYTHLTLPTTSRV